jgi:ATP-binding cassette subfamily F protein uup
MALLLNCDGLSKHFGIRPIFTGLTFGIAEGERVGVIGPNGAGKSTLLNVLAGLEHADDGEVTSRRGLRIAYLPQVDEFRDGATVESVLDEALAGSHLEVHERQVQVDITVTKFGFADRTQAAETLSGGWRKRLALARELIQAPDLLLLDEPTNHLDLEAILWLEELLLTAPFAFLLVSHDRYLLERVTTRILEVNPRYPEGILSIPGTYSDFLLKREEVVQGQTSQQLSLASKVRTELAWLARGARARATKAKGRIDDIGELQEELLAAKRRTSSERTADLAFDGTGRKTQRLLMAKQLTMVRGGRTLFRDLSFTLAPRMKLGVLGANGSGKTTLIHLLTGALAPDAGEVWLADGVKVTYFSQSRHELDLNVSLRRALAPTGDNLLFRGQPIHVAGWAKRFLFDPDQLPLQVSELSGGEQARILIARLMLQPADILILDEPTNDLDIPSLEVLEESLEDFPGTLVLVTHDRYMLDRLCTDLLTLDGKGGTAFFAEYAQWERAREDALATVQAKAPAKPTLAKGRSLTPRAFSWKEARELEGMEETILAAEGDVEALTQTLGEPTSHADHQRMSELSARLHDAQLTVERLYARWAELEEKRGGADGG